MLPGRQTMPRWNSLLSSMPYQKIARRRVDGIDVTQLEHSRMSADDLLDILPDIHPDVGLGFWNMNRLGSAGFTYTVKDNQGQDDEAGKEILDNLLDRINERFGGIDGLLVQWIQSAYGRGAVCGEVSLTDDLKDIRDFHAVNPRTVEFRYDSLTGELLMYHKPKSGPEVLLNPEKFWYVPIDPAIDDPYGRSPVAPALQEVWFDISIISDLRKVVHHQGWPRIDIKVIEEVLVNSAPQGIKSNPKELREWLDDRLFDIQEAYNDIGPDDSFVHYDAVEIGTYGGSPTGRMMDINQVVRAIERRMIKALKQLPILMGSNEGTTETHGTVQWTIFVEGLKSLQNPIKHILSRMMGLALEVYGHQGRVEIEFDALRTTDRLLDAQAEQAEISNAAEKYNQGWQSWEESAIEITGSAPPEGMEPPARQTAGSPAPEPTPEPGRKRDLNLPNVRSGESVESSPGLERAVTSYLDQARELFIKGLPDED